MRVGDDDFAAAHVTNSPRHVAEQKDVAREALDREVFVHRADERAVFFRDDAIVGQLGNRAAVHQGREARMAARAELAVHARRGR